MLYLLMGSIIFKPWEKCTGALVCVCGGEGTASVSIWKNQSRLGWAGSDPEIPAWGESDEIPALCSTAPWGSSFGAVPGIPGGMREPWGLWWVQISTSTLLAKAGPCWGSWAGFKHLTEAAWL